MSFLRRAVSESLLAATGSASDKEDGIATQGKDNTMCTEPNQSRSSAEQQPLPSGHRRVYHYDEDAPGGEKCRAGCVCGWIGPWHGDDREEDLDYRDHIVDQLGSGAHYHARVICLNCSYEGPAQCVIGSPVPSNSCPACSCLGELQSVHGTVGAIARLLHRARQGE